MRKCGIAVLLVGLLCSLSFAQLPVRTIVLRNVTLIDGTGKPPRKSVSLLLGRGRVLEVGPKVDEPNGAIIVDGAGKYVIPGLIDARVQLNTSPANRVLRSESGLEQRIARLHALLSAGVTTARLVQGDILEERVYDRYVDEILLASPNLVASGPTFTAPDGALTDEYTVLATRAKDRELRQIKDADEARDLARQVAHAGAAAFEVAFDAGLKDHPFPRLSQEALATLVKEAHGHDLKVFCWVGTNDEATKAIAEGVDVIEGVTEEALSDALLAEMKKKNVAYLPALSFQGDLINLVNADALKKYLTEPIVQQSLSPVLQKSLSTEGGILQEVRTALTVQPDLKPRFEQQQKRAFDNVRRAQAAGVSIAVGTGAGSLLIFPGASEHRELQLLVKAGLTPMQALVAATRNTAAALGKGEDSGTLEPGKVADLVILNANPLDDLTNAQKIDTIIVGGRRWKQTQMEIY